MENNHADFAFLFKALADETRLKIIGLLSSGELCACDILKYFNITQPTLSYHMKILTDCGIVNAIRIGAWMHYTLNDDTIKRISEYWSRCTGEKAGCSCNACCEKSENCNSEC